MGKKSLILLISGITLAFASVTASAQCNPDPLVEKCSGKLGGFTFLKSYKLEGASDIEYSYVFSKDTQYMLSVCNSSEEVPKITVSLYDKDRKLLATNYNKKDDKYYPGLGYNCTATGIYYMTYSIQSGDKCGVSVVGFKK